MLSKDKRLSALAWAAAEAGQSYGRFTVNMTHQDKVKIYKRYQTYLDERAAQSPMTEEQKELPRKRGRKRKIAAAQA